MLYFNFNGKIFEEGISVLSPNSRAFRYGDGVFETIKVKSGNILFAQEHMQRLWKGLKLFQFDIPKYFTKEKILDEIDALVQKNKHASLARVRLTVFKGDGGLYDAVNHLPNYTIQTRVIDNVKEEFNVKGLLVGFYEDAQKSCNAFSNIKHNNFLPYTMAALTAKQNKWNDALVLNQYGNICDSTIANIFIVKDEHVFTPPLTQGCIEGITRNYIIKTLQSHGFVVTETSLSKQTILNADEVFFTNVIQNIKWVGQIEDKKYTNTLTQKIVLLLFQQK